MINREIEVNDPLLDKYTITTTKGKVYSFEREGRQFFLRDGEKTIGRIVQEESHSGSIWDEKECIGDYDFRKGEYIVTPHVEGSLRVQKERDTHPLEFLFDKTVESSWGRYWKHQIYIDEGEN